MKDIPSDWTFKSVNVVNQFDRHVREQLPWYELATGLVAHIVRHYLPQNGLIYDIGASTGNIEIAIQDILEKREATFIPIDHSEEMSKKYAGKRDVVICEADQYDYKHFDIAILFLVLQFMTIESRRNLLQTLNARIKPGGAIIIFDKMLVDGGFVATVMRRATMAGKLANGAKPEEIVAKELSLGGAQRPLPNKYFLGSLATDGCVEIFRFGEFAGFIIERPE